MLLWLQWVLLSLLGVEGYHDGHQAEEPLDMTVTADFSSATLKASWRDNFHSESTMEKGIYEIEVRRTEQMTLVHGDAVEAVVNQAAIYQWEWTSPIPLECTSHSLRLRFKDLHHTSNWTSWHIVEGLDTNSNGKTEIYPHSKSFKVGSKVTFCCIWKSDTELKTEEFKIRISNRTYVSAPVHSDSPTGPGGFDMKCDDIGSTVFFGYPPDDQDLICETRDLDFVACNWSTGQPTYLTGSRKETKYSLDGRNCSRPCVQNHNINDGKVTWTLTAKNDLGKVKINYTADLKHRVWLYAPREMLIPKKSVHARNATLQWQWRVKRYRSFPMVCQVELSSAEQSEKQNFSGQGLQSLILLDLQPYTTYTVRLQCASAQHFWKWGDWSNTATFSTTEDIPEALDIWMQASSINTTFILWRPLTKRQSNGEIREYSVTMGHSLGREKEERRGVPTQQTCLALSSVYDTVSISAVNAAGSSPSSSLSIPSLGSDTSVDMEPSKATVDGRGGFNVTWSASHDASCGYVVDWFPTYSTESCSVEWMKLPPGNANVLVHSDRFEDGVRYTLSVYACTLGGPELQQRSEGYVNELRPKESVQDLSAKQDGAAVTLSWKAVPSEGQRGFILGYYVNYSKSDGSFSKRTTVDDPSARNYTLILPPHKYTFVVTAYTSAGEGKQALYILTMTTQFPFIEVAVVLVAATCFLTFVIILCNRNWARVKASVYPDIPHPSLPDGWPIKGATDWRVMDENKNNLSTVEIQSPPDQPGEADSEKNQNEESQALVKFESPIPVTQTRCVDLQEAQPLSTSIACLTLMVPTCADIENPTYNLSVLTPMDVALTLDYTSQSQTVRCPPCDTDMTYQSFEKVCHG